MLTDDELRDILREKCKKRGGQAEWAKKHHFKRQNVSATIAGHRKISKRMARKLGYVKRWVKV